MKTRLTLQSAKAPLKSRQWFRQARYGMFIHYGLYSILARREWAMCYERIPIKEYRALASQFKPSTRCVSDWIDFARKNGMRYACLVTRHHEGFALFNTKANNFSSVNSPAQRDLVHEYVTACRKAGIGVGLYYSVADWSDNGFMAGPRRAPRAWERFVQTAHIQLRELMTNYGRVDYLFYDGCPPPKIWRATEINAEIRRLQPHILISDRCGLEEDVASCEGHVGGNSKKLWESCITSNESWGINDADPDWKTPRQVVQLLMTCAHNGGNLLFNVGPTAEGRIPPQSVYLLERVGRWLKLNGEAVYGTDPHPFNYADQKLSTSQGRTAYVALLWYFGPETVIASVGNRVKQVRLLANGRKIRFRQDGNRIHLIGLPAKSADPLLPVLALELDGEPRGVPNPGILKNNV